LHRVWAEIQLRGYRVSHADVAAGVLVIEHQDNAASLFKSVSVRTDAVLRRDDGELVYPFPGRVLLKASEVDAQQSGLRTTLLAPGYQLYESAVHDVASAVAHLEGVGFGAEAMEIDAISFRELAYEEEAASFVAALYGETAYLAKSTGKVRNLRPVPGKFTVFYVPGPAEDPTESFAGSGFALLDYDGRDQIALVEAVEAPGERSSLQGKLATFSRWAALAADSGSDLSPVTATCPVLQDEDGREVHVDPGRALVRFFDSAALEPASREILTREVRSATWLSANLVEVQLIDPGKLFRWLADISSLEIVAIAEPLVRDFRPEREENEDPQSQGAVWNLEAVNAAEAWKISIGRRDVIVAIIDMGFDLTAKALVDAFLPRGTERWNFVGPALSPQDMIRSHGTNVAGIIAASHSAEGVRGVAPGCSLLPLKAWEKSITSSTLIKALQYIREFAARDASTSMVVNCSFGTTFSEAVADTIGSLSAAGIPVVASAGNDSQQDVPHFPSDYDNVISVAGIGPGDKFASDYSNLGRMVDILAPGGIGRDGGPGENLLVLGPANTISVKYGTSFASPHVAGAIALMLSAAKATGRSLALLEILTILNKAAKKVDSANPGLNGLLGAGLLDVAEAVRLAAQP
jgi:major intracellular serine protease